ncbi:phosphomevalonate kinase [Amycolatopsis sp. NPDC054798]
MNTSRKVVRRVPGKLFVVGEYAVVEPGHPAILVGIDRQASVAVSAASEDDVVIASDLCPGATRLRREGKKLAGRTPGDERRAREDLAHVVSAIDVLHELLDERRMPVPRLRIAVSSDLHEQGTKLGLGSSGAVTAAAVAAAAGYCGLALPDHAWFRLALLATARIDPSLSGADLAAGIWGGWIAYYAPDRAEVLDLARRRGIEESLRAAWPGFGVRRLTPPEGLTTEVGWTGHPASTSSLIASLTAKRNGPEDKAYQGFLADTTACVRASLRALALGDNRALLRQIRRARTTLARLDDALGLGIFTPRLTMLCDAAESVGGAAKPSGAGGGDCGIALLEAGAARKHAQLRAQWAAKGVLPVPLRVPALPRDAA